MLQTDNRSGVQKLLLLYQRRIEKEVQEQKRLAKMYTYEREKLNMGYRLIAGIDEAGRGPLAGPVVAAAVILHPDQSIIGLNDSKKLSPEQREKLRKEIEQSAIAIGVGMVDASEIDRINILQATYQAMRLAIQACSPQPECLLVDAVHIPALEIEQTSLVKGDQLSQSIAAASIIAKTTRDQWMCEQAAEAYPKYCFDQHMGYGTPLHLELLKKYGPSPIHRYSFAPVRQYAQKGTPS